MLLAAEKVMREPNANLRPSDSLFNLPIRVEPILTGSKWAIVVKGKFIALSPAMNDLLCHASAEDLQSLGEKIMAVAVEPEWFEDYRRGWSGASWPVQGVENCAIGHR